MAGPQAGKVVSALRAGGTYLAYGILDPSPMQLSVMDLLAQGKVARGFICYQVGGWVPCCVACAMTTL